MSTSVPVRLSDELQDQFHSAQGLDSWRLQGAWPEASGGYRFVLWAPRAQEVYVKGDFSGWSGLQLQRSGEFFVGVVPNAQADQLYKFDVKGSDGRFVERADPYAFATEVRPGTASKLTHPLGRHPWLDDDWMQARATRDVLNAPMSIYELHLGSWVRHGDGRSYGYREIADRLIDHVSGLGFSHVEFLPLTEHPYDPSWGYQVTGYFAPTSRFGDPDGLRYLIDRLHRAGIGVIWIGCPPTFPKTATA